MKEEYYKAMGFLIVYEILCSQISCIIYTHITVVKINKKHVRHVTANILKGIHLKGRNEWITLRWI